MELNFDTGIKEFDVNGRHKLRINTSDQNMYFRVTSMMGELREIEKRYIQKMAEISQCQTIEDQLSANAKMYSIMREIDLEVKAKLSFAFGNENDFDEVFDGVNVMAVTSNGDSVLANFLNAIAPIINESSVLSEQAIKKAVGDREARKAKNEQMGTAKGSNN